MLRLQFAIVLWISLLILCPSVSAVNKTSNTTHAVIQGGKPRSGDSSSTLLGVMIEVKSKSKNSITIYWTPPKNNKTQCKFIIRDNMASIEKRVTISYEPANHEKDILIKGLFPKSLYEVTVECKAHNHKEIWIRKFVKTLPDIYNITTDNNVGRDGKRKGNEEEEEKEPKIQRVKTKEILESTTTTQTKEGEITGESTTQTKEGEITGESTTQIKEEEITDSGRLVSQRNQMTSETSVGNDNTQSQSKMSILKWLIPTIAGSGICLIVIVAGALAFSHTMFKNGTFKINQNASPSQTDEKDLDNPIDSKNVGNQNDPEIEGDSKYTTEISSGNTLQVRQPPHLMPGYDTRVALSCISWGSEFDKLDSHEPYDMTSPSSLHRPSITDHSRRGPNAATATMRQDSFPGSGQRLPMASSFQTGGFSCNEQPIYAETSINSVVPVMNNRIQGENIYSNVNTPESIYMNTTSQFEESPPFIPPRPR